MTTIKETLISFIDAIGTKDNPLSLVEYAKKQNIPLESLLFAVEILGVFNALILTEENIVFATNEIALHFLKSFSIYLKHDAKIFTSWDPVTQDPKAFYNNLKSFGINFLRLIEDKRVNSLDIKDVLSKKELVVIVIKAILKDAGDEPFFLYQYNLKTTKFQTIGGYKSESESLEESAVRHLREELELNKLESKDVKLEFLPNIFYNYGVSVREGVYTEYDIKICSVEFNIENVKLTGLDRWISRNEIEDGFTLDGIPILPFPEDKETKLKYLDNILLSFKSAQVNLSTNSPLYSKDDQELNFTTLLNKYLKQDESEEIEFKSSSRWDYNQNKVNKDLEKVIAKTIAAFMNSSGGILMIGVSDDKEVLGIDKDISTLNKKNEDGYIQHIISLISNYIGIEYAGFVNISIEKPEDISVCVIQIKRAPKPVFVKNNENKDFYVRIANTSRQLNTEDSYKYIQLNW